MSKSHKHTNPKLAVMFGPGQILRDEIAARDITQADLATAIGKSRQFVNELIGGTRRFSFEAAILLESALGIDSDFWLRAESNYRKHVEAKAVEKLRLDVRKRVAKFPASVHGRFVIAHLKKAGVTVSTPKKRRITATVAKKRTAAYLGGKTAARKSRAASSLPQRKTSK